MPARTVRSFDGEIGKKLAVAAEGVANAGFTGALVSMRSCAVAALSDCDMGDAIGAVNRSAAAAPRLGEAAGESGASFTADSRRAGVSMVESGWARTASLVATLSAGRTRPLWRACVRGDRPS